MTWIHWRGRTFWREKYVRWSERKGKN